MELRHLRYFLAVGEALNFTRAAAQLRVAQPALSRQVQDLEDEIGVDLMRRSPRGVTLTAEGKLFLDEVRELLKRADESVEKVRALARGEYGELHVGYAPSPTVEILPPALAAFQKAVPRVKVLLHDLQYAYKWSNPRRFATAMASVRLKTFSFLNNDCTWLLTVTSVMARSAPI